MLELAKSYYIAAGQLLSLPRFLALLLVVWIADAIGLGGKLVDAVFAWHDHIQVPFEEKIGDFVLWLHLLIA